MMQDEKPNDNEFEQFFGYNENSRTIHFSFRLSKFNFRPISSSIIMTDKKYNFESDFHKIFRKLVAFIFKLIDLA